MFGKDDLGNIFVVVGDKLIYEEGDYFPLDQVKDDLFVSKCHSIVELHDAVCFQQVKDGNSTLIWKREEKKAEETPVKDEKPENAITITPDEFLEVVKKANEHFMEIAKEAPGAEVVDVLMGMQNLAFGALIAQTLFGADADEE
jgi:hypothetical protein